MNQFTIKTKVKSKCELHNLENTHNGVKYF